MRNALALTLLGLTVLAMPAGGQETAPTPPKTEPAPVETAEAAEDEFVPPDGWRPKKRGKFTVYCRKEYNAKGTRFPTETCYDEAGIRAMLAAQLEDREKIDQLRRICAGDVSCGSN